MNAVTIEGMPTAPMSAPRIAKGAVQSYEARSSPTRLRLTSSESSRIRYVLAEWAGDCGLRSNVGPQLEKLAQRPEHATRRTKADYDAVWQAQSVRVSSRVWDSDIGAVWHRAWWDDEQKIYVHAQQALYRDVDFAQELWCQKSAAVRSEILRSWRALRLLANAASPDIVALFALYGDMLPGIPDAGMWPKDVDSEYRRVCRYADSGGGAYEIERATRVDRTRRKDETAEARETRIRFDQGERQALLREIGRECEVMIVHATTAYRDAWRSA
jgi:hypothetical protein